MATEHTERYLGNYRLVRLLGKGGQAAVYLGEHRYLKRLAAIKVMRTSLDERKGQKFCTEAQLLASLSHAHIVRVLEFGLEQGMPFLVMDYAPKGSLSALFPRGFALPPEKVVHYITQVADALQYAHDHHIVHRDVKPENLLLTAPHHIVLSDFGIALLEPSLDQIGTQERAGTLPYMAPEQLRGRPCYASDQYALGIVAYEWLCGCRPFEGSPIEVIDQHNFTPPPPLREKQPSVSRAVEIVVLKSLAKDPELRYDCVATFAQALADANRMKTLVRRLDLNATVSYNSSPDTGPARSSLLQSPEKPPASLLPDDILPPAAGQTGNPRRNKRLVRSTGNRDRQCMLARVRSFWITSFLEQSLNHKRPLNLNFVECPDAAANPWKDVLQDVRPPVRPLASGTRITQIYDEADGELLILGQPGSGKTILLLELTRHLLERAEQDENHPISAVFSLSSWADQQLPFALWLVEELNSKYQVPRRLGQQWIDGGMLLPVLDGLDEVAVEYRSACIEAINLYRREHGAEPLIMCSRSEEYLAQPERVLLRRAVMVQPLTAQQINVYLQNAEGNLAALHQALRLDPALQELATTPLMLNILTSVYRDGTLEEEGFSPLDSSQSRQQQIFAAYVKQALHRRRPATSYGSQQTMQWLSNLAQQLKSHNQVIFYLEQMQPDWIRSRHWRRVYEWLAVRFVGFFVGLLCGLAGNDLLYRNGTPVGILTDMFIGGFTGYLFSGRTARQFFQPRKQSAKENSWASLLKRDFWVNLSKGEILSSGMMAGLIIWTVAGLSKGLFKGSLFGICTIVLNIVFLKTASVYTRSGVREGIRRSLSNGLLVGFAYAFCNWLSSGSGNLTLAGFGYSVVRDGIRYGLIGILLSVILMRDKGQVQPIEIVSWSWKRLGRSLSDPGQIKSGLLVGLFVGLANGVSYGLGNGLGSGFTTGLTNGFSFGIGYALIIALVYWLLCGFFQGLRSERLDNRRRILPNEGLRRSAWNVLYIGIGSVALGVLVYVLGNMLYFALNDGLRGPLNNLFAMHSTQHIVSVHVVKTHSTKTHSSKNPPAPTTFIGGLLYGLNVSLASCWLAALVAGLLAGLFGGGLACLRHGLLRALLWRTRSLALNIPHFLDYAAERILLRKVGGGYIFLHPLLLDYFAARGRQSEQKKLIHRQARAPLALSGTLDTGDEPYQSAVLPAIRLPDRKVRGRDIV